MYDFVIMGPKVIAGNLNFHGISRFSKFCRHLEIAKDAQFSHMQFNFITLKMTSLRSHQLRYLNQFQILKKSINIFQLISITDAIDIIS